MGEWRFGICLDKCGAAWSEYSALHDSPSVCCDADPASTKSLAIVFAFEPSSSRDFRQQSPRPNPRLPPSLHAKPIELAFEHSLSHRANTPLLDRVTQTSRPAPGLVLLWLSLLNFAWSADTCEAEGAGKCGRRGSRRVISEGSGGGRWGDGSRMRRGGDAQSVG